MRRQAPPSLAVIMLLLVSFAAQLHAKEVVLKLKPGAKPDDAVMRAILTPKPLPGDVYQVRQRLLGNKAGVLKTHLLANRGQENPTLGSFSFFETYSGPMQGGTVKEGELFFGYFSERRDGKLAVLQGEAGGSLLIELITWDYTKKVYNFYQLIRTEDSAEWVYHGNSNDILLDVAEINLGHRNAEFGRRVRCAACHTLGAPILKELEAPHNDWATAKSKL